MEINLLFSDGTSALVWIDQRVPSLSIHPGGTECAKKAIEKALSGRVLGVSSCNGYTQFFLNFRSLGAIINRLQKTMDLST